MRLRLIYVVGNKLPGVAGFSSSSSPAEEAVENQEDNGSKSGDNDAPQVE